MFLMSHLFSGGFFLSFIKKTWVFNQIVHPTLVKALKRRRK